MRTKLRILHALEAFAGGTERHLLDLVRHVPGAEHVTISEVVLVPGPTALLAPAWLPWENRIKPGDLDPEAGTVGGRDEAVHDLEGFRPSTDAFALARGEAIAAAFAFATSCASRLGGGGATRASARSPRILAWTTRMRRGRCSLVRSPMCTSTASC